jgi:allantoin racemase
MALILLQEGAAQGLRRHRDRGEAGALRDWVFRGIVALPRSKSGEVALPIRIRVVTPITTEAFRSSLDAEQLSSEDVKVSFVNIDAGTASIECDYEIMLAQPGTIAKIIEAERQGADAVVIDCMGDPGLSGARECVSIPVLGPMQTAMGVAAMLGHKFSVVTVLSRIIPMIETQAAVYGMSSKLASARSVEIPVLELEKDMAATKRALVAEARKAIVEDGADYIIFGCTGMLGCADAVREGLLSDGLDVPVIDPVPTAINVAAAVVRSRLSHSKRAYRPPPRKSVVGYEAIGIGAQTREAAE